jgi:hypothetical protein
LNTANCVAPDGLAGKLTSEISAFARDFRTPVVQQASVSLEKEIARRFAVGANYTYVHGTHLIRSRDLNLPQPVQLRYPVFDQSNKLAGYYAVDSFADWQKTRTMDCLKAPCMGNLARPIPELGMINVFESAASSIYHGLTLSARRRMSSGLYFRMAYTWSHAIDDGQDALTYVSAVQNAYATKSERAASVTDQRHRILIYPSRQKAPRDNPYSEA